MSLRPLLLIPILAACAPEPGASIAPSDPILAGDPRLVDRLFIIRALGDRCFDYGLAPKRNSPIVIMACKSSATQQFRVKEIDFASHDFGLLIPNTSLCVGVGGVGPVNQGHGLVAQPCDGSSKQRFAFDGDALLVGRQDKDSRVSRDFALEPKDAVTVEGTQVVVGFRDLSDAEFWRMIAVDGSDARPTSGFVRATDYHELDLALALGWGTVVELEPPDDHIRLERLWDLPNGIDPDGNNIVRSGMTLRGGRKFLFNGPELSMDEDLAVESLDFAIGVEEHSRITGLRLRGPSRAKDAGVFGLLIQHNTGQPLTNVIVDHVEISNFSVGIQVSGSRPHGGELDTTVCVDKFHDLPIADIVGNFIHHDHYGVSVDAGGYALTRRNLVYYSAHEVTADGNAANRYLVHDTLFTNDDDDQGSEIDVHGSCSVDESKFVGGRAGDLFDIGWNTFLNKDRTPLKIRGTPCHYAFFHDNVGVKEKGVTEVDTEPKTGPECTIAAGDEDQILFADANQFGYSDPLRTHGGVGELRVGDFDGDGTEDLFLGTGVTWWFSSGGKAEWRFLNRMPERASDLRFGDFDADGRTDVIRVHGLIVEVSWAGGSDWKRLSAAMPVSATIDDIAVGQFDLDPRADLFLADGTQWRWASAGAVWDFFAFSEFRTRELRFGDFNGAGTTDVFGVVSGKWQIVRGPGEQWQVHGEARSTDIDELVVADFDGDGLADVGQYQFSFPNAEWFVSKNGTSPYAFLREAPLLDLLGLLPIGRFDEEPGADVLYFDDLHLHIASGGSGASAWSRQSMR